MENQHKWKPSKFVRINGQYRASRNPGEVGIASRLVADIIAGYYDRYLKIYANGKLLDLGCGKVPLYELYKDYVSENVCVDWSNSLHRNKFLDIEHDITKPLPFSASEFDTIIFSDVLEHLPEPDNVFKEISRVLRPNGHLILNVPFIYWLHEQPHDYYRYTEYAIKRFVELSDLKIVQLEAIGGVPEIMADIFSKTIIRIPRIGPKAAALTQYLTWKFISTSFGKKVSNSTKNEFPLGYFLVASK